MYRSINCNHSAIFDFQENIEGLPVDQHPEVWTLLTKILISNLISRYVHPPAMFRLF